MRGWGRLLAWTGLMAVLGLLPLIVGWGDLPDPVATHWGVGGQPDGSTPKAWLWVLPLFVVGIGLATSSFMRREGRPSAEAVAIVGFLGGVGAWVSLTIAMLNSGVDTWEDARPFSWWQVLVVLGVGVGFGLIGYQIGKRWYPLTPITADSAAPVMDLGEDERATWTGSVQVVWIYLLMVPLAVVFFFLPGWLRWLAPAFLVLAWLFAKVTVVVDAGGLQVKLAGFWTVKTIAVDRVVTARPIDLEPAQWAGWGYRVVPGGSAVVLRRGDAIEVLLKNDRRFAVTVDDAATGAALLNGQVRRLAASG